MSGPFASAAMQLHAFGLVPVPCSANDDGKTPGIRSKNWKSGPGADTTRQMVLRFPKANIGILTGLSCVTVVDIDSAALVADMIRRFGGTPLVVETPSAGIHLYYRGAGERCANLRRSEGLEVDIKGVGGFVVVPPSVRPSGPHAGKLYSFVEGGWDDVARLPAIRPGSLPELARATPGARPAPIPDGTRHKDLLRHALKHARGCGNFDDLLDKVRWINECCVPPLPEADVVKATRSAWNYEREGRNFAPGEKGRAMVTYESEFAILAPAAGGTDAMALLLLLRSRHFDKPHFAVSPEGMARDRTIPGWTERRIRRARDTLADLGFLAVVSRGGSRPGDAKQFSFADRQDGCGK